MSVDKTWHYRLTLEVEHTGGRSCEFFDIIGVTGFQDFAILNSNTVNRRSTTVHRDNLAVEENCLRLGCGLGCSKRCPHQTEDKHGA